MADLITGVFYDRAAPEVAVDQLETLGYERAQIRTPLTRDAFPNRQSIRQFVASASCACLSIAVMFGASTISASAQTTTSAPTDAASTVSQPDQDHHDWGWLGLIGLVGLAGLRRQPRDTEIRTTNRN